MFWVLAFATVLGVAIYECIAIVVDYQRAPVVVSYIVKESKSLLLPDVIICPFNRFNRTFLLENHISDELTNFIQFSYGLGGHLYKFQHNIKPNISDELIEALDSALDGMNMSFTEFVYAASISCYSVIPYCIHPTLGLIDCCSTAQDTMTSVGKCYRIQGFEQDAAFSLYIPMCITVPVDPYEQDAAGYGFGLTLVINIPYEIYTPSLNNIHNDGIAVKLAEKHHGLDYDLTFIPNGVHALMPLQTTVYDFINDPPRYTCIDAYRNYSRVNCFDDCIFADARILCNCSHVASLHKEFPACKTHEFYNCLIVQTLEGMQSDPNFVLNCRQNCKPNCSYSSFTTSVSYAKFPAPTINGFVSAQELLEYRNTILLDVFYQNLEYTMIKHFPSMTVDTFIANLGGQIGLWVGGSILTLLQLIVFLVQYLCSRKRSRPLNNRAPSLNSKVEACNNNDSSADPLNAQKGPFRNVYYRKDNNDIIDLGIVSDRDQ